MDNAFWDKASPTAIGAVVGGFATIAAIAVKEWLDRRRAIQAWYEDLFISEGISQLIVYLSAVEDLLTTLDLKDAVPPDLLEPYPRVAAERFRKLFPNCVYAMVWLQIVRANCDKTISNPRSDEQGVRHALDLTRGLRENLTALEKELLVLSIKRKSKVYQIRNNKRIKPLLTTLEQKQGELLTKLKQGQGELLTTPRS